MIQCHLVGNVSYKLIFLCLTLSFLLPPATIVTSSVPTSMAGHMMYTSPHTVMYASTPTLADGGLAVLNTFSQGPSAMQVSHGQCQDTGETTLDYSRLRWDTGETTSVMG